MVKQPDIIPKTDSLYELEKQYLYSWNEGDKTFRIIVPKGFVYDGASVPRVLWSITGVTRDGLIRAAALIHDWIYFNCGNMPPSSFQFFNVLTHNWEDCLYQISREYADRLLKQITIEAGESSFKANAIYIAVRLFGGSHWRKNNG